jgi:hypothetical protein
LVYLYLGPLGVKWYYIDREAKQIVLWAESEKKQTGSYPADLGDYKFQHPGYKEYIDYSENGWVGFVVSYTVGTPSTNHHYDPENKWYYQDD